MKMTLLEMTQDILFAVEADEITSITDTPEAEAVARVIQNTYYQLVTDQTVPELESLFKFADASSKVFFLIPTDVSDICWFKYNIKKLIGDDDAFQDLIYQDSKTFLDWVSMNKSTDTTSTLVTDPTSAVTFYVNNIKPPQYWTSFDDKYITCDSYDSTLDTAGLTGVKTKGLCKKLPTWTMVDSFTPQIDDNYFPLLLAESKSTVFVNQKQTANPKIERQAKNQRIFLSNDKYRTRASEEGSTNSQNGSPNYGRRRGST